MLLKLNEKKHLFDEPLLDLVAVKANPDYTLLLEFENGEMRHFDMNSLMEKAPFTKLKAPGLFLMASIDYGTVVWPGNIDIAPETLYERSKPISS